MTKKSDEYKLIRKALILLAISIILCFSGLAIGLSWYGLIPFAIGLLMALYVFKMLMS